MSHNEWKAIGKKAGWWEIDSVDTGQIEWDQPEKKEKGGLINAIPGSDDKHDLYNGDGPADKFGFCIDDIIEEYEATWNRKPTMKEIQAAFNFVYNALPETQGLKDDRNNEDNEESDK